ncbi:MAG: hypothetical protein EH225_07755 [Calditrichaeota bacterium]|nr:MAG: hypothetical protein EH225_07755 [Calditrichota bacterium]
MNRLTQNSISIFIVVLLWFTATGITREDSLTSSPVPLHFSKQGETYHLFPYSLSPGQVLRYHVWQNQTEIWSQPPSGGLKKPQFLPGSMPTRPPSAPSSVFGLEYRESSLYIPPLVRDYMDYKMGRDRYLPIVTPVLLGYLVYNALRYSNTILGKDSIATDINFLPGSPEKKMLDILREKSPLTEKEWYTLYIQNSGDQSPDFPKFLEMIRSLESGEFIRSVENSEGSTEFFLDFSRRSDFDKRKLKN